MLCSKGELYISSEALSEMRTGRVIEVWRNAVDTNQKYSRSPSRLHEWYSEMITRACTASKQLLLLQNRSYVPPPAVYTFTMKTENTSVTYAVKMDANQEEPGFTSFPPNNYRQVTAEFHTCLSKQWALQIGFTSSTYLVADNLFLHLLTNLFAIKYLHVQDYVS